MFLALVLLFPLQCLCKLGDAGSRIGRGRLKTVDITVVLIGAAMVAVVVGGSWLKKAGVESFSNEQWCLLPLCLSLDEAALIRRGLAVRVFAKVGLGWTALRLCSRV